MKKIVLTMIAAFAAISMNAQSQMYVGGSLGYQSTAYDGTSTGSSLSFVPEFGVQLDEKWGVGVELGYTTSTTKGTPDLTSSKFSFAPYARFTALNFGPVSVFADGQFTYYTGNNEAAVAGAAVDNKYNGWGIAIKPGIAYNVTDNFAFVAKFGDVLGYSSQKPDGGKASTTLNVLRLNNTINFGLFYKF